MNSTFSLLALWRTLATPKDGGDLAFTAMPIPGHPGARLARSAEGPAILFEISGQAAHLAPIVLRNLSVKHNARCRIEDGGQVQEGQFTVVMCTSQDPGLHGLFLDAIQPLLGRVDSSDPRVVTAVVNALVELFRALGRPAETSVLGLWGELFLISVASDPDRMVGAWHVMPNDRYDFAFQDQRIEVKTTVGRRHHTFSLVQLNPPKGVEAAIASIVTEVSAAGATVRELIATICDRALSSEVASQLLISTSKVLGSDIAAWGDSRYDQARAAESLRFFPSKLIPQPRCPSERVWDVTFRADLEGLQSLPLPLPRELGAAATPFSS
ncbi:MAG: PD-(D/E)XK motif protein [Fimbriimonadaceae bacterium]|nr:PD-(D/E)XK motif protein [Fimbriimonadaceae bacterium]